MAKFSDHLAKVQRLLGIERTTAQPPLSGSNLSNGSAYIQPFEIVPGMPAARFLGPQPMPWEAIGCSLPHNAYGQEKIDGFRAFALCTRILSREALPLDMAIHCLPAIAELEKAYGEPMVFDGEYRAIDGFQATISEHKKGIGTGSLWLFDAVPYREWRQNRFSERLDARVPRLVEKVEALGATFVHALPLIPLATAEDARSQAAAIWARGGEGLVVKRGASRYSRERTGDWLKLKQMHTLDVWISDLVIEPTKVIGMIGPNRVKAIIARQEDGKVIKIGSAIPEDLRMDMARRPEKFTGTCIEVGFTDRTESGALRGGHFLRLRPDKAAQ